MHGAMPVALILMAALLSGCSGSDSGDSNAPDANSTGPVGKSTTSRAPGQTGSAAPASSASKAPGNTDGNDPPSGTVTVDVNGTAATFTITGSDPDQDPLAWTLAFGDGQKTEGTAVPATLEHTFSQGGDLTAVYTLSDGKITRTYNATFTVAVGVQEVVHSGHVVVADPWAAALDGCLMDAGRRDAGGPPGVTGQDHPIEATQWGWAFSLDKPGLIAEFWSDEPAILGHGNSGVVPAEATYVVVCVKDPAAANSDYQLTLKVA